MPIIAISSLTDVNHIVLCSDLTYGDILKHGKQIGSELWKCFRCLCNTQHYQIPCVGISFPFEAPSPTNVTIHFLLDTNS